MFDLEKAREVWGPLVAVGYPQVSEARVTEIVETSPQDNFLPNTGEQLVGLMASLGYRSLTSFDLRKLAGEESLPVLCVQVTYRRAYIKRYSLRRSPGENFFLTYQPDPYHKGAFMVRSADLVRDSNLGLSWLFYFILINEGE